MLLPGLIDPYDPDRIDCASYHLSVGVQAFVTQDMQEATEPAAEVVTVLTEPPRNLLTIPPGQFALLVTHEKVTVPASAIALISMRAKYKFRGLINVSGFHVDPGFNGHLIFTVYNAGPAAIIIEKAEPIFLIIYADLNQETKRTYKGKTGKSQIPLDYVHALIGAQVFSPQVLRKRLERIDESMTKIDGYSTVATWLAAVIVALLALPAAFVTFFPSWPGVVIARTLDAANYEIRQKADPPTAVGTPAVKAKDPEVKQTAVQGTVPDAANLEIPQNAGPSTTATPSLGGRAPQLKQPWVPKKVPKAISPVPTSGNLPSTEKP